MCVCVCVCVCVISKAVFTAVTAKNAVFWDVTPCGSYENRRFRGTIRTKRISVLGALAVTDSSPPMMEAIRSSETSVLARATRRHIPEDCILHSHRRENLESYIELTGWTLERRHVSPVRYEMGFYIPEDGILHSHRRENLKSNKKTTFGKLDLFLSSCEGRETPTVLGPLGRADLNNWPAPSRDPTGKASPSTHLGTEEDPASETLFYCYLEYRTTNKVYKPSDSECYAPLSVPTGIYCAL
jgi:hypothetical protein